MLFRPFSAHLEHILGFFQALWAYFRPFWTYFWAFSRLFYPFQAIENCVHRTRIIGLIQGVFSQFGSYFGPFPGFLGPFQPIWRVFLGFFPGVLAYFQAFCYLFRPFWTELRPQNACPQNVHLQNAKFCPFPGFMDLFQPWAYFWPIFLVIGAYFWLCSMECDSWS